jgi:hypothetical protein
MVTSPTETLTVFASGVTPGSIITVPPAPCKGQRVRQRVSMRGVENLRDWDNENRGQDDSFLEAFDGSLMLCSMRRRVGPRR